MGPVGRRPKNLFFDNMAASLTDVIGKPIRLHLAPVEAYKAQLMKVCAIEYLAQSLVAMHAATVDGLDSSDLPDT